MPKSTNHRDRIVQSALELFAAHGYTGASISMITADAKVSKGLFYNFFEFKEDLLKELLTIAFDDIGASLVAYRIQRDPRKAIQQHIQATCAIVKERANFWRMLHAIRLQEGVQGVMLAGYRDMVNEVTSIFEATFEKLGFESPRLEALLFLSQIDGMVILYLQDPNTPLDKLAAHLIKRYTK